MPNLTPCPTDDQLSQLAAGALTGDGLDVLERHLDGCVACRQVVAAVSNGSMPAMRPSDRPTLRPGDSLGRYEIERLIGAGGMGMLYLARDPQLNRRVALKLMRPSLAAVGGRLRLLREAQAMAQLNHPNVVSVFDLGEVEGRVFVAMELLEGGTLRDWMKKPHGWKDVVATFCEAGEGLAAAHASGVVHRDFKPENVMMGRDERPKVGDFGLARPELVAEEEPPLALQLPLNVTATGTMLGTPAYMAPEQLAGKPADGRSDQYGFCVCLYEALAGQRPFPADTLEELRARVIGGMPTPPKDGLVPAHVWAAVARGLNPNPAQRFPDMQALLTVLRFPPLPARKGAPVWRNAALALGLISVVSVSGAAALLFMQSSRVVPSDTAPKQPVPEVATPMPPASSEVVESRPIETGGPGEPKGAVDFPESNIELELGEEKTFRLRNVNRMAIGDAAVANVRTSGDRLVVSGLSVGKTTLLVWIGDDTRQSATVRVKAPVGRAPLVVTQVEILEVVSSHKAALRRCGEEQRKREPSRTGMLVMQWVILTSGKVSKVTVVTEELKGSYIAQCLGALIKSMVFPRHEQPSAPVEFPFKF